MLVVVRAGVSLNTNCGTGGIGCYYTLIPNMFAFAHKLHRKFKFDRTACCCDCDIAIFFAACYGQNTVFNAYTFSCAYRPCNRLIGYFITILIEHLCRVSSCYTGANIQTIFCDFYSVFVDNHARRSRRRPQQIIFICCRNRHLTEDCARSCIYNDFIICSRSGFTCVSRSFGSCADPTVFKGYTLQSLVQKFNRVGNDIVRR